MGTDAGNFYISKFELDAGGITCNFNELKSTSIQIGVSIYAD